VVIIFVQIFFTIQEFQSSIIIQESLVRSVVDICKIANI